MKKTCCALLALSVSSPAWAGDETAHAISAGAAGSNLAPVAGVLGYRFRALSELQLGLELEGGMVRRGWVAGYQVEGGGAFGGLALVQGTIVRLGALWLDLRGAAGARHHAAATSDPLSQSVAGDPLSSSTAFVADVAVLANIDAGRWLTVRAGVDVPVAVQLDPAAEVDTTGFLTLAGLALHVSDDVSLTLDGVGGGVFGFGGDGAKVYLRGQLGVRWLIGDDTRSWRAF